MTGLSWIATTGGDETGLVRGRVYDCGAHFSVYFDTQRLGNYLTQRAAKEAADRAFLRTRLRPWWKFWA